ARRADAAGEALAELLANLGLEVVFVGLGHVVLLWSAARGPSCAVCQLERSAVQMICYVRKAPGSPTASITASDEECPRRSSVHESSAVRSSSRMLRDRRQNRLGDLVDGARIAHRDARLVVVEVL